MKEGLIAIIIAGVFMAWLVHASPYGGQHEPMIHQRLLNRRENRLPGAIGFPRAGTCRFCIGNVGRGCIQPQ